VYKFDYLLLIEVVLGTTFVMFVIDVWLDFVLIFVFNAVTSLLDPKLILEIVLATLLYELL
jgi:hypothetical protein